MANQNGKSGMTLADRDKKVLLILLSIILIVLAWFMGFQKFNEKRKSVVEDNQKLEKEVLELRKKVSKRASIEEDTAKKQAVIDKVVMHYPSEVRTQTVIAWLDQLERKIKDVTIETESFTMNQIFFRDGAVLDNVMTQEAAQEQAAGDASQNNTDSNGGEQANDSAQSTSSQAYIGYRSDTNITFSTNYEKLKKILNYLNTYSDSDRTNVKEVSISSEAGSKPLKCTMTVSSFALGGREVEYKEPTIKSMNMEKDNIFK